MLCKTVLVPFFFSSNTNYISYLVFSLTCNLRTICELSLLIYRDGYSFYLDVNNKSILFFI